MSLFESETHAVLGFNRITLGSPRHATELLHGFDSAQAFFAEYRANTANLPPRLSSRLSKPLSSEIVTGIDRDIEWLVKAGRKLISIFDDAYPFLLQQIADPPVCLFCMGDHQLLKKEQIAIVGSRKPTQLGIKIAQRFGAELSAQGLVVTSGLAHGIDAAAHGGVLDGDGKTIAVFGSGIDTIYPRYHERLARRLVENGLIISEFPIGTPPLGRHFPQRNRIVTGMSLGTVVIEATLKSGSMISANMAMEQCRDVFAIPGSIYSAQSEGCHELIKLGAKLTQGVDDILEELSGYGRETGINPAPNLSKEAAGIFQYISADPLSVDDLFELTQIPIPSLLSQLLNLELDGLIVNESFGYVRASH
jgi:DNA processing protein